jgi:hypothetical protein
MLHIKDQLPETRIKEAVFISHPTLSKTMFMMCAASHRDAVTAKKELEIFTSKTKRWVFC